jgi:hypothetical protein
MIGPVVPPFYKKPTVERDSAPLILRRFETVRDDSEKQIAAIETDFISCIS